MLSVLSIHLMKSAAACPFFEPFGMPSSQLPIIPRPLPLGPCGIGMYATLPLTWLTLGRSEEHTPELQSPCNLVCRLLLEKKKKKLKNETVRKNKSRRKEQTKKIIN